MKYKPAASQPRSDTTTENNEKSRINNNNKSDKLSFMDVNAYNNDDNLLLLSSELNQYHPKMLTGEDNDNDCFNYNNNETINFNYPLEMTADLAINSSCLHYENDPCVNNVDTTNNIIYHHHPLHTNTTSNYIYSSNNHDSFLYDIYDHSSSTIQNDHFHNTQPSINHLLFDNLYMHDNHDDGLKNNIIDPCLNTHDITSSFVVGDCDGIENKLDATINPSVEIAQTQNYTHKPYLSSSTINNNSIVVMNDKSLEITPSNQNNQTNNNNTSNNIILLSSSLSQLQAITATTTSTANCIGHNQSIDSIFGKNIVKSVNDIMKQSSSSSSTATTSINNSSLQSTPKSTTTTSISNNNNDSNNFSTSSSSSSNTTISIDGSPQTNINKISKNDQLNDHSENIILTSNNNNINDSSDYKNVENIVNKILVPMKYNSYNDIIDLDNQFYKLNLENITDNHYYHHHHGTQIPMNNYQLSQHDYINNQLLYSQNQQFNDSSNMNFYHNPVDISEITGSVVNKHYYTTPSSITSTTTNNNSSNNNNNGSGNVTTTTNNNHPKSEITNNNSTVTSNSITTSNYTQTCTKNASGVGIQSNTPNNIPHQHSYSMTNTPSNNHFINSRKIKYNNTNHNIHRSMINSPQLIHLQPTAPSSTTTNTNCSNIHSNIASATQNTSYLPHGIINPNNCFAIPSHVVNPNVIVTSSELKNIPNSHAVPQLLLDKVNKLEAFRNNIASFTNLTLKDIQGWIVDFSRDQHGSRFIQQKMEKSTNGVDRDIVFKEIIATDTILYTLMTDVFGNYVVQKMLEYGNEHQKCVIASHLKGRVLVLTTQMYGCRVIQKAIECISKDIQADLIHELDGHVLECVKDQNGNHVIQKCIEYVPAVNLDFIINEFNGRVYELSSHPYGCRVIQRLMEHCSASQTHSLMLEIFENLPSLVKDQYGNYVIQHILDHRKHQDFPNRIINYVFDNIFTLSAHKFASNVVEKCIQFSSSTQKEELIRYILRNSDGGCNDNLYMMMKDPFANYVVQKIVDSVNGEIRKQLLLKMKPYFINLKKLTYGKHMINKVDRWLKETETMTSFIKCEEEFPSLNSAGPSG